MALPASLLLEAVRKRDENRKRKVIEEHDMISQITCLVRGIQFCVPAPLGSIRLFVGR